MTTQPLPTHCDSRESFRPQEQGGGSRDPGLKAPAGRADGLSWFFLMPPTRVPQS